MSDTTDQPVPEPERTPEPDAERERPERTPEPDTEPVDQHRGPLDDDEDGRWLNPDDPRRIDAERRRGAPFDADSIRGDDAPA